jgi:DNA-directed RNA polymerase subunit M/transcription elongation factor TFIIS
MKQKYFIINNKQKYSSKLDIKSEVDKLHEINIKANKQLLKLYPQYTGNKIKNMPKESLNIKDNSELIIICQKCGKKHFIEYYELQDTSNDKKIMLCKECGEKLKNFLNIN